MVRQYHFFNIPIPEASISLGQNGPESCLPASSGSDDGKDAPGSPHIYIYIYIYLYIYIYNPVLTHNCRLQHPPHNDRD